MVFVRNRPFFDFFFYFRTCRPGKCLLYPRKMCLRYSRTKKAFLGYKNKSSKSRKIEIFPKGLVQGFGRKLALFFAFYYSTTCWPGKCLLRYSKTKKNLFRL